jgi:predicted phosphodiesterase
MAAKSDQTKANSLKNLVNESEGSKHSEKMLGDIAEMIKSKGIDLSSIGRIKNVSMYQTITKNEEGEAEIHNLQAIQFSPSWETGPEWPVVKQGPPIQLQKPTAKPKSKTKFKTAVIVPDIQFGFFRNKSGELEGTHDEKAITLALQMMEDANPDLVVCVGDNLDLPEMGKYVTYPSYAQTTQASIDRATRFCAEMRQAAPHAKIVWLAGNHEERMPKYLVQNAGAAYGLRRGHEPDSWPVLSVPFLCRMDDYGVEYRPGYPAADLWINEKLRVIHGDRVKSNGSTAHVYLNQEKTSVLYGHIHRIEVAFKTREDYDGPRTIMAASPGCLARIDGAIPSTRGGVDLDGRPLTRHENWQQGLGFVTYEESGNHAFAYENVTIYDGWAMWRGKEYQA